MSPMAPLRYCSMTGCQTKVAFGRCALHARPAWTHAQPVARIRGRRLQRLRDQLFQRSPLCVLCLAMVPPRYTIATIRDHVVNLAEGGQDVEANTMAICQSCSDAKTAEESKRGQMRKRQP
jgi:5-methylcytosine-specific restriction enzyme A